MKLYFYIYFIFRMLQFRDGNKVILVMGYFLFFFFEQLVQGLYCVLVDLFCLIFLDDKRWIS